MDYNSVATSSSTNCFADTSATPSYLSYLSYNYDTTTTPILATFQPNTFPTITIATAGNSYTISAENSSVKSSIKSEKSKEELFPIEKKIKERIAQNKKNAGIGEYFTDIKEYVPNKVYEFTITTNYSSSKKIKTVCDENDEFSLEKAFFIALAKYYYQKALTPEGIVKQAETMMCTYTYIKTVRDGMKLFKLLKEKEEWEKQEEERKKLKHQKYVQKKKDRKERLKAKENSDLRKIIVEAIKESK